MKPSVINHALPTATSKMTTDSSHVAPICASTTVHTLNVASAAQQTSKNLEAVRSGVRKTGYGPWAACSKSGFKEHATGPCDNLASEMAGKLDRRQANIGLLGHSLARH